MLLSEDHKPWKPKEKQRIENYGSKVTQDKRIDGILAVSRAFGDSMFKRKISAMGLGK